MRRIPERKAALVNIQTIALVGCDGEPYHPCPDTHGDICKKCLNRIVTVAVRGLAGKEGDERE